MNVSKTLAAKNLGFWNIPFYKGEYIYPIYISTYTPVSGRRRILSKPTNMRRRRSRRSGERSAEKVFQTNEHAKEEEQAQM